MEYYLATVNNKLFIKKNLDEFQGHYNALRKISGSYSVYDSIYIAFWK